MRLVALLVSHGVLTRDAVRTAVGLEPVDPGAVGRLRNEVAALEVDLEGAQQANAALRRENEDAYTGLLDAVARIDEALEEWEWEYGDDEPLDALDERVNALCTEYEVLEVEVE